MTDALDRLAACGTDLLARVDALLDGVGVPGGHPIVPLLRRFGARPGEALSAVLDMRPRDLAATASALRAQVPRYADVPAAVGADLDWEGAGARAFATRWTGLVAHVCGPGDSMTARLEHTAGFADAVADWAAHSREALARSLAEVLASAQAVTVLTAPPSGGEEPPLDAARAAADIGARVLDTVATAYAAAEHLLTCAAPASDVLDYQALGEPDDFWPRHTRLGG